MKNTLLIPDYNRKLRAALAHIPDTAQRIKPVRTHRDIAHLCGVSGVYVIFQPEGLYVGSSKNLRARLTNWRAILGPFKFKAYKHDEPRKAEQRVLKELRARGYVLLNKNDAVKQYVRHPKKKAAPKKKRGPKVRRFVTIDGVTKPMSVWCRETGISVECAGMRIKHLGWSEAAAVTTPKRGA